jgi:hypothetical protein
MLAGSSGLTYPLGNEPDSGMHLHIAKNSGGEFCGDDEWVVVGDILQALKTRPDGKPVTSILLNPLLRGKSVNTRGFLLQHSCTRSGLSEAPPTRAGKPLSAASSGQGTSYSRYENPTCKTCHRKIGRTAEMDLDEARRPAKRLRAGRPAGRRSTRGGPRVGQ